MSAPQKFPLADFNRTIGFSRPLANPLGPPAANGYDLYPAYDVRAFPAGWFGFKNGTIFPRWLNLTFANVPSPFSGSAYWQGPLLFGATIHTWYPDWSGYSVVPGLWGYHHAGVKSRNRPSREWVISVGDIDHLHGPSYALTPWADVGAGSVGLRLLMAWGNGSNGDLGLPNATWTKSWTGRSIDQGWFSGAVLTWSGNVSGDSTGWTDSTVTIEQPAH